MLDTVEIAKNIKSCAKNKGIRLSDMLNDLGLGVNAISQLSAGKEMSFITFAKNATNNMPNKKEQKEDVVVAWVQS